FPAASDVLTIAKVWSILPPFLILNVTDPALTDFTVGVTLNSFSVRPTDVPEDDASAIGTPIPTARAATAAGRTSLRMLTPSFVCLGSGVRVPLRTVAEAPPRRRR